MDSTLNPHHLLALMQNTIGIVDHHEIRETLIEASKVIGHNKRTFPVLDALASLCVSKSRGQVVALALQLSQRDKKLRLTIAENDEVDDSIVPYLRSLWCQIQRLSTIFQQGRQIRHETSEDPNIPPGSPPLPRDVAYDLRLALFREIHMHTIVKNQSRIRKYWHDFNIFMDRLYAKRGLNLEGLEANLADVFFAQKYVKELCTLSQLQSADADYWHKSYRFMRCASYLISEMLKEGDTSCEKLEKEIGQDPRQKSQFNLRRTLQKLISQQRRFETLLEFANSPRLHSILLYDLELQVVPATKRISVPIPSSEALWKNVIHNICCPYLRSGSDWHDQEAAKQGKEIPNKLISEKQQAERNDLDLSHAVTTCLPTTSNTVDIPGRSYEPLHPLKLKAEEIPTSSHVSATGTGIQWSKIPTFSYIGVSKLSCGACNAWLRAYNRLGYPQFYTRGSHRKWHWPWGLPELACDLLCREIVEEISRVFIEHHRANKNLLRSSESSQGHAPSVRSVVSDEDMADMNAYRMEQAPHTYQLSQEIIPPSSKP
ncbi:hypothetical protein HOY82DRAFT_668468 [Tuber indicum]|nr:hypothetical protein HOY82DRAFT_668468 [Tuber indicum]